MQTNVALHTSGRTKHYGAVAVVDQLDLAIPAGTIFGFLGPNGAGKTTAIRMLLGLVRPTAGSATIFGADCQRDRAAIAAQVGAHSSDLRAEEYIPRDDLMRFAAHERFFVAELAA